MTKLESFYLSRYLQAPKRHLGRFTFTFMVLGIVLSVGILSAGLNLFSGYERSLREVLMGSFPHALIQSAYNEQLSEADCDRITRLLKSSREVESIIPVLSSSVMTRHPGKVRGAMLTAYGNTEGEKLPYIKYITKGNTVPMLGEVILGKYLAREHGLGVGDSITVVFPRMDRISPLGMIPSERKMRICGIYNSGFYENDRSMLITNLKDAISILDTGSGFTKLELRFKANEVDNANELANRIQQLLGPDVSVYPWTVFSAGLLRLVAMEKWLIFIIFSFLVLIAGINVISATTTLIFDNSNEIALLKTMGASDRTISRLFSLRVGMVAILAIIAGQLLGAGLSLFVEKQGFYHLKGDVYFIDSLSANISPLNLLVVFLVAFSLIWVCILYPLRRISKLQIVDILRNS